LLAPKFLLLSKYGIVEGMIQSVNERVLDISDHPISFLYTGSAPHLWFLSSLLLGITILTLAVRTGFQKWLPILAIAFYMVGLAQGSYNELAGGILDVKFNIGRLPFVLLFISAGSILEKNDTNLNLMPIQPLIIIIFGFLLQIIEAALLLKFFNHSLEQHEFLIGTAVSGIGIALFAVAKPDMGNKSALAQLGKYTLGVYCIHLFLINSPISWIVKGYFNYPVWQVFFPILITALSFALTILMSRISLLRNVVM
jgi:surface polysaccharide O-acyltransferase-like enzyme